MPVQRRCRMALPSELLQLPLPGARASARTAARDASSFFPSAFTEAGNKAKAVPAASAAAGTKDSGNSTSADVGQAIGAAQHAEAESTYAVDKAVETLKLAKEARFIAWMALAVAAGVAFIDLMSASIDLMTFRRDTKRQD